MLNEIGGLAAGLAHGMNLGMQWQNMKEQQSMQKRQMDRLEKGDARDTERHAAQMEVYNSEKEVREKRKAALAETADYTMKNVRGFAQPQQQAPAPSVAQDPNSPGFSAPPEQQTPSGIQLAGPIPSGGLAMNAPAPYAADNPAAAAGLGAAPQQQEPQKPPMEPSQMFSAGMATGAYSPQHLTDIAGIWAKHGLHEEGLKYMTQADAAEKRGLTRGAMALMRGNVDAGMQALRGAGIEFEDRPVKVKPDDPNDHNWKVNISGEGEKTINVKDWMKSTVDVDTFFKIEDDQRKAAQEESKTKFEQDTKWPVEKAELLAKTETEKYKQRRLSADAGRLARMPLARSASSEKSIERAIDRRDKRFDQKSMVPSEDGSGKMVVDHDMRAEYDNIAADMQDMIEEETGKELDHRQHHKLTDEILRFPIGGTPQEKQAAQERLLDRFKLDAKTDPATESATEAKPDPEALSGERREKVDVPEALKAEPTREEKELAQLKFTGAADIPTLKKYHLDRTASNLSAKDRAELEQKIKELVAKHSKQAPGLKTSARHRAPSSDPEVAPAGYGKRQDGTDKGKGWLGVHKSTNGNDMTEYTVGLNIGGRDVDVPTFVPGLSKEELAHLKTEPDMSKRSAINESILRKAAAHAKKRMAEGKSVFADQQVTSK